MTAVGAIGTPVNEVPTDQLVVVAIGGFDPSGGAGVVRDFLTARSWGAAVRMIPTAWTEQSASGVQSVEAREGRALAAAIRSAWQGGADRVARMVVKIGMIPDAAVAGVVREALDGFGGPVVFDPVLAASSGGSLFTGDPAALLDLGRRATLFTPNSVEAAALTGLLVGDRAQAAEAGAALCALGLPAVLVKGGHLPGDRVEDVLISDAEVRRFEAPRVPGPAVRGTGCALATAIALGLGQGLSRGDAIARAKRWLTGAISQPVRVGEQWHLRL